MKGGQDVALTPQPPWDACSLPGAGEGEQAFSPRPVEGEGLGVRGRDREQLEQD